VAGTAAALSAAGDRCGFGCVGRGVIRRVVGVAQARGAKAAPSVIRKAPAFSEPCQQDAADIPCTIRDAVKNPAAEWQPLFSENSEPLQMPQHVPPPRKYMGQLREQNLRLFDSLSEADLDKLTQAPPKGA
jgi:hypothetical protein